MAKISISIANEDLIKIDEFCTRERYSRSQLLVKGALQIIFPQISNVPKLPEGTKFKPNNIMLVDDIKPRCERQFCRTFSEGRYKVVTNDGSEEWSGNLCTFHWNQARKEGEVSAL